MATGVVGDQKYPLTQLAFWIIDEDGPQLAPKGRNESSRI